MPDSQKPVNRSTLHTLAICAGLSFLAVVVGRQEFAVWQLKNQVEAQDQRLRDLREGWNGLEELHRRVTETWLEQLRLQREFHRLQKPAGAKEVPKDIPRGKEGA